MEGYFMYVAEKFSQIRFGKEKPIKLLSINELKTWAFWRGALAEFVGTLLFVYLGCASAVPMDNTPQSTIKIAFAFGLAIMALIQMFGHISGGHFNPAVSIGLAAGFLISPIRAVIYTIAQTVGAIIGGMILRGVTPGIYNATLGVTTVSSQLTVGQGLGMEIMLTFVLVFVIIATTDGDRTDFGSAALKIGLTVTLLHLAGITYTGSSMNPARTLGSSVASNNYQAQWVYWVGPIIGGCVASLLYKFLFSPYRGAVSKEDAIQQMLSDDSMILVPRDYFRQAGTVNGEKMKSTSNF